VAQLHSHLPILTFHIHHFQRLFEQYRLNLPRLAVVDEEIKLPLAQRQDWETLCQHAALDLEHEECVVSWHVFLWTRLPLELVLLRAPGKHLFSPGRIIPSERQFTPFALKSALLHQC
jgi:hypothetical protein